MIIYPGMIIDSSIFNFERYYYEVVFEEVNNNFFEKLFSGKEKKRLYTIREISINTNNIYYLNNYKTFGDSTPKIFWDNPYDPQDTIIQAKFRQFPSSDNVIFSSKELDT